jgi:hypothetical protein
MAISWGLLGRLRTNCLRTAIEWGEKGGEIKKPLIVSGKIVGVQANYSPPEG